MLQELRASLCLLILFTLMTGIGYPLMVTGLARSLFPYQANGSLVDKDNRIIGSTLIGQNFTGDKYFHGRPSAAGDGYDGNNSSGSNLAPTSTDLLKTMTQRVADARQSGETTAVPVDLVTASGSGLDPDISVAGALFQSERVAATRDLSLHVVRELIGRHITPRTFGVLGENRVNVLSLNLELDQLSP